MPTTQKIYRGERPLDDEIGDCKVFVIALDSQGKEQSSALLHHVDLHSPDGFEWGYSGSGPADLALSILADFYGEKPTRQKLFAGNCKCWGPHQDFKRQFVAPAPKSGFEIRSDEVAAFLSKWLSTHPDA